MKLSTVKIERGSGRNRYSSGREEKAEEEEKEEVMVKKRK